MSLFFKSCVGETAFGSVCILKTTCRRTTGCPVLTKIRVRCIHQSEELFWLQHEYRNSPKFKAVWVHPDCWTIREKSMCGGGLGGFVGCCVALLFFFKGRGVVNIKHTSRHCLSRSTWMTQCVTQMTPCRPTLCLGTGRRYRKCKCRRDWGMAWKLHLNRAPNKCFCCRVRKKEKSAV